MRAVRLCMCLKHLVLGISSHVATLHFNHLHLQFNIAIYASIFLLIPGFSYPHLLGTTINIQFEFEFSIRENERIWLLPKNYPRLSCIEPGKQYQRHKTMAILFNCNLQMELKFIRRTFSPAQCPYCVSGCGRSDKIHDYRK